MRKSYTENPSAFEEKWGKMQLGTGCNHRASPRTRLDFVPEKAQPIGRSSDLQAPYLPQLPSSWLNQCSKSGRSFLLTAAGQLRTLTGFPFGPLAKSRHRRRHQYKGKQTKCQSE